MSHSPSQSASQNQCRFEELVDIEAFKRLLERFFETTGIPNGLVDADGTLLAMSSGKNACELFHRMQPASAARCRESNLDIMRDLCQGQISGGLCRNGLIDYATPIVIEGRQLATLFLGQILHTPPDPEFFRSQARQFGYDEESYLAAIDAIPIVEKARAEALMQVMVEMANMLAESGLAKIRQAVLEHEINVHSERRIELEDILESSPVAIGWSNSDNQVEYINRRFTQLFGYTLEDIPDIETWYRLAYPSEDYRHSHIQPWYKIVTLAHQTGTVPPELEADVTCKDGSKRRVVIRVSWVGNLRLVNYTDITERWQQDQRKRAQDAILQMVARGVGLTDILTAIVQQVELEDPTALCSILLLDKDGQCLLSGAAPHLPDFYSKAIHGVRIGMGVGSCGTAAYLGQRVIVEDIQTHEYWKPYTQLAEAANLRACWSEPIISSRGKVLGTFAVYHAHPQSPLPKDIERIGFAANVASIAIENRQAYEELELRAYSDYLTGLANRRYFLEQAESELARVQRYGSPLSILMLDVDYFKHINDTYGHKVGDLVLQKLASVCKATLRDVDVVGRIGGEEFAVILPETANVAAAEAAERLRAALAAAEVPLSERDPLRFTVSVGVVTLGAAGASVDTLLNQADQALYLAKHAGRNRVCTFDQVAGLNEMNEGAA
jgi:diguanylate cyclase (GGDEF)-like protein/PAS domain S-box-containing protein